MLPTEVSAELSKLRKARKVQQNATVLVATKTKFPSLVETLLGCATGKLNVSFRTETKEHGIVTGASSILDPGKIRFNGDILEYLPDGKRPDPRMTLANNAENRVEVTVNSVRLVKEPSRERVYWEFKAE